jgi:hypothetical protein
MTADRIRHGIAAPSSQPLVGVFLDDESDEVAYFVDDAATPAADLSPGARDALSVIGAWSDLDWDALTDELDRIRHASPPTPPVDLDA